MIKLIGCVLIIAACSQMGCAMASDKIKQMKYLKLLRRLIFESKAMIEGGMTFGEIVSKLVSQKDYKEFTFLSEDTYSPDVRTKIAVSIQNSKLFDNESRQTAVDFFENLGTTDTNGQLAYISMNLAALDEQICRLSENFSSQIRLCRALGVLSGAFIAILLI
ncbi:stage III sporulation protein AB [uncultured Ruminococcus sp.]|uniref:stage III sporulation protein AB n=1 Tax=uncultured Ruminococcus sp. TaxID=165186 RepID=UPI0026138846|nr:stage III sporulation protein AB [uncultured Ruminococcus sp.]